MKATVERHTVRLLVLDSGGRILLMKCDDPSVPGRASLFWATLGGGINSGEDVRSAALREAREETGHAVRLGPEVWYGEHILEVSGVPTRFRERFFVAFLDAASVSREGWTEAERRVIRGMRWWTSDELNVTDEIIFPAVMKELLPEITQGNIPRSPICIEL